ncbi:hypothetical protein N0V94_005621 [Neodidymelliopsis sp. IMI 364377]|nr:hypothetical protein N0V94_005621 [Neodidymelliopsis sp. IMI 364377]
MAEKEKPTGENGDIHTPRMQLNAQQRTILDRQTNGLPEGKASKSNIMAYATNFDVFVLLVSVISAIVAGALNPLLTVLYGQMVGSFHDFQNGTLSSSQLNHEIAKFNLYFVYLAIGIFVFIYISTAGFYYSGERIIRQLRHAYLRAILRQNMAFFDTLGAGEVTNRITSDMNIVQEGVTSKISLTLTAAATFIAAYVIAFIEYWKLALILTSTIIVMLATGTTGGKLAFKNSRESFKHHLGSANVADESIGSVRVVNAFGIQRALAEKYQTFLKKAEKPGIKARISIAFMICFMNGLPFLSYGLSFWQGGRYFLSGHMSAAAVVTLTMAIVIGAFAIGRVAPNTQAFMSSMASGSGIVRSMQRRSPLDPLAKEGVKPEQPALGEITLTNLSLVYPSREDVTVLNDITIRIPAGKTTAIVGPTGCGKSSIVGLLERFYEPTGGQITLDGRDTRDLNLHWLRSQIAYVGQEPTLFNTTIFENIRHGLACRKPAPQGKELDSLVIQAAKDANAHNFIVAFPGGYNTVVGEKGLQLSGGQRQRIAIARALVRNPAILILDEATSALDSRSERIVQSTLDAATVGRTTIVIAHRLSTIRNADQIIVLSKGIVVEQGKHDDLMARNDLYANLVRKQHIAQEASEVMQTLDITTAPETAVNVADEKAAFDERQPSIAGKTLQSTAPEIHETPERLSMWQFGRLVYRLNHTERGLMFLGLFGSILAGLGTPVQAIFFAKLIDALSLPRSDIPSEMSFWALMYLMLGIVAIASWFGQGACFAFSSERLICRAKEALFKAILRQEIGFFDSHGTGELTLMLSQDTTHLAGLDGAVLGSILTFISTIIGGIVLSLIIGWKLALVCTAMMPITVGMGYMRLIILSLFDRKVRQTQSVSTAYAAEAVAAIRTVASLSLEGHVLNEYGAIMDRDAADSLRSILQASALYAASQSVVMLCGSLIFWYGGTLIASHEYTMLQFFICFSSLITGSQTAGAVFSFAPDMSKALHAGARLKEVLDRRSAMDTSNPGGKQIESCLGSVEMHSVSFRYATRPERLVLDQVSLSVKAGQTIALVGPSGCGKSTIIALLERFFEPEGGQISVDGNEISKLDVNDYRNLVSYVGQEPTIYSGTIRENIVLGSNNANVTEDDIIQACKDGNIYEFILSLP